MARSIAVRTGQGDAAFPDPSLKATSATFGSVTSTILINGITTVDAFDHTTGRRILVDFCNPYKPDTETTVAAQARRMRELADTLRREAERLERLVEKAARA